MNKILVIIVFVSGFFLLPSSLYAQREIDKGRSDYKRIMKDKKKEEKRKKKLDKMDPKQAYREALVDAQKDFIKHNKKIQTRETRKMMRKAKRRSKRFNKGKGEQPFYKRWWLKIKYEMRW